MINDLITDNSITLQEELNWFAKILNTRFKLYFNKECENTSIYEIEAPNLAEHTSTYAKIIEYYSFGKEERIILLLALVPHIYPNLLDIFFAKNKTYNRGHSEFGGLIGETHSGFLPTAETAIFLLAGNDLTLRFRVMEYFKPHSPLVHYNLISLDIPKKKEPKLSGLLSISEEYLSFFTTGTEYKPDFSSHFPAKLITTKMDWNDLVLEDYVLDDVIEIEAWLKYSDIIMNEWELGKVIKPAYRGLFYGPPGTGKTLTAMLIGKSTNLDVYRIDLSQVVSKYIGETEKNMANIFNQAENKNWILFFDEADALFGKRTSTSDAKDRYANQEVAYLLQRIEDFPGVVILATNMKSNIDEAFSRRFQNMIHFPMPSSSQRFKLWTKVFSGRCKLAPDINFKEIADNYPLSGGAIINVLRYCSISVLRNNREEILYRDIIDGIRKEFEKEGKTI